MESPKNSMPEWIDPNGSRVPAYARKYNARKHKMTSFGVFEESRTGSAPEVTQQNNDNEVQQSASAKLAESAVNTYIGELVINNLQKLANNIKESNPNIVEETMQIKAEIEKEIEKMSMHYPRLAKQLLGNLKASQNTIQMWRQFSKDSPKIISGYCKNNARELKMVEDILDPDSSDEVFEQKLRSLDERAIRNSPFWYYVNHFSYISSKGLKRNISVVTFDEDKDYNYLPVEFVYFLLSGREHSPGVSLVD